MSQNDAAAWLRLVMPRDLGPRGIIALLRQFGSPEQVLAARPAQWASVLHARQIASLQAGPDPDLLQQTLDWAKQPHHHLITLDDADYPALLLEIGDPPPLLYGMGQRDLLRRPALAVVGSRHATPQGILDARAFSHALSEAGLTIVSGLALGVDAAAHEGALRGPGSTLAVVGTGLDRVYPARNKALAHRIAESGLVLSEFPLTTAAAAGHFPRRNRLIAGLTLGCLVVEAAVRSGSLITARQAGEFGREVFAMPGSIHAPLARGCHQLIKDGAKLVETVADILQELGQPPGQAARDPATPSPARRDAASHPLLAALPTAPIALDTLVTQTGLTPDKLYAMLLELELAGAVASLPGGLYQRLHHPTA